VTTRLTLKILQQLGVVVPQLRCLLRDHLELVCDLGELAAGRRQACRGCAQVTLQLRHPRLERRLLTSGGLGSVPSGGFGGSYGSLGPLRSLFSRRSRSELLDLRLGESQPRRQRVLLGGSCCSSGLGGGGAVLRRLADGFKGRPCRRLTRRCSGRRHSGYDKLHLQLGPLCTEFKCCAGSPLTR
jgi:hypothetical protein